MLLGSCTCFRANQHQQPSSQAAKQLPAPSKISSDKSLLSGTFVFASALASPLAANAQAHAAALPTYTYWEQFGLAIAPGLPMIIVVTSFIVFGSNSVKSELGAKIDSSAAKIDSLTVAIENKLDMQDAKIDPD